MGGRTTGTWEPGIPSPNPNGRPPDDKSWAGLMRKKCQEIDPETGKFWKDIILDAAFKQMAEGDFQHFKHMVDRMDGLQTQKIQAEMTTIAIKHPPKPDDDALGETKEEDETDDATRTI